MRILVDMDGVITDFEREFLERWRQQHPDKLHIPLEERTIFYLIKQYPAEYDKHIRQIISTAGFYRDQRPIPGSLESLSEMLKLGLEVFICTSPLTDYQNCVLEKFEWVDRHLGKEWVNRLILAKDKTMVLADILIADKPQVDGVVTRTPWEHVLYDAPYNKKVTGKRRLTWANWKEVLSV